MFEDMVPRALENSRRGLEYLDQNYPGWEKLVSEDLDMRNGGRCVVAHLTGRNYEAGLSMLGLQNSMAANLGFFVPGEPEDSEVISEYAILTQVFKTGRNNRLTRTSTKMSEVKKLKRDEEFVGV